MKTIKYVLSGILILGILGFIFKRSKNETKKATTEIIYQDYSNQVDKNISKLSTERKLQREKWLKELSETITYKELIKNKIVSLEYLPVLTSINDAIKNTLSVNGKTEFRITENFAKKVEDSNNGEDKMQFIIIISSLSINANGGLNKEIIEVFENYKNKYGLHGEKDKIYYIEGGKTENLKTTFNLSHVFAVLNPNNEKILDAVYETNFSSLEGWSENTNFTYPYLINKVAFIEHLKEINSDSKYLPKMDDIDVWNEFDPDVKTRVEMLIFNKDCNGLQNELNAADENLKRFHNSGKTSNKHFELMNFVDEKMRKLECYNE